MTRKVKPKGQALMVVKTEEFLPVVQVAAEFKHRYGDLVFDCASKTGDKQARVARQELKEAQTKLEKARVAKKAPHLEAIRTIDDEAKRIDKMLEELKEPIHAQIKAEEGRQEREREERAKAEEQRVALIQQAINDLRQSARMPTWATVEELESMIAMIEDVVIGDDFAEFQDDAQVVKEEAIDNLRRLHTRAVELRSEREQAAKDRAELEELRAKIKVVEVAVPHTFGCDCPECVASRFAPLPDAVPGRTGVSPLVSEARVPTDTPTPIDDVLRRALRFVADLKLKTANDRVERDVVAIMLSRQLSWWQAKREVYRG